MKKTFKTLMLSLVAVLAALTCFACGGDTETPVNYDGTYRCYEDHQYIFMTISGDSMSLYVGETEAFTDSVKLKVGDYKLTARTADGITAENTGSLQNLIVEYKATTQDGQPALVNEAKNRTFVKI